MFAVHGSTTIARLGVVTFVTILMTSFEVGCAGIIVGMLTACDQHV